MDNIIQFPISHKATPHELLELIGQSIEGTVLNDAQIKEYLDIINPILLEFDFTHNIELTVTAPEGSNIGHNLGEVDSAFGKHLAKLIMSRCIRELELYISSQSFN
jgi:hypothetical protein